MAFGGDPLSKTDQLYVDRVAAGSFSLPEAERVANRRQVPWPFMRPWVKRNERTTQEGPKQEIYHDILTTNPSFLGLVMNQLTNQ